MSKRSVVWYAKARLATEVDLQEALYKGLATPNVPVTAELLLRIQQGLIQSEDVDNELKRYVQLTLDRFPN